MSVRVHPARPLCSLHPNKVRGLDPDDHRQPACAHHTTGLRRAVDQAKPTPAGASALGIHIILEPLERVDLSDDGARLRARPARPARLQPAQRLVVRRLSHHHPHAGPPRALQPDVIRLLVGHRVVRRPSRERRPPMRVVGADGKPRPQQVAGEIKLSAGAVDHGVAAERGGDAEAVIRLPGDHVAAGAHVAGDVDVVVDESEDPPVPDARPGAVHRRIDLGLGKGRAARTRHERKAGARSARQHQRAPAGSAGHGQVPAARG
jgi:hypothetical protein